jgi:hypothetical protein
VDVPEQSPAASRRATLLAGVVAVLALVFVAVVVLGSEGPDNSTEAHPPASPSTALAHSSGMVDESVEAFRDHHDKTWPASVWTEERNLKMTGHGASEVYAPGVDKGVRVTWYRTRGDRFAYCLTVGLRHLVVISTSTQVSKREATGACPAPSLTPVLDPA